MTEAEVRDELQWLGCCYLDSAYIDKGVQGGLTRAAFISKTSGEQWAYLALRRAGGHSTDSASIYASAKTDGVLDRLGGLEAILEAQQAAPTSVNARTLLELIIDNHKRRQAHVLFSNGERLLKDGKTNVQEITKIAEEVVRVCSGRNDSQVSIRDLADEVEAEAREAMSGKPKPLGETISWGLPYLDRIAGPMQKHEYVVIGGRTSHGKSSLTIQIAGHNAKLGIRTVLFSLETSAKAVIKQMAGQLARVNLRKLSEETVDAQQRLLAEINWLRSCKNLHIFDRDLTTEQISSRCRMLQQSFQPQLVVIDHLHVIAGDGDEFTRVSNASKAMIPLQKQLGCTLIAAAQLNRSSEAEEREPTRTDFRGSGSIEEDAARLIAIWRHPRQDYDNRYFDTDIIQLKCRDGVLCAKACRFDAHTTTFQEVEVKQ